ncbi:transposase [Microbacterium suaedae]|uniref:transposase n=1 Tax=Microbacterium suaedae TaxID=2067813 RepID=UPI000DA12771
MPRSTGRPPGARSAAGPRGAGAFPRDWAPYHAVLIDGIHIGSWCLLIALSDTGRVLAWQCCARENTAAWKALFEQIPAPGIVVSDGGSGLPSALRQAWPETKHQRCLFRPQMTSPVISPSNREPRQGARSGTW